MMDQLDFDEAARRAQVGSERALEHAGTVWAEQAFEWLQGYLRTHTHLHPDDARNHGCPVPPDWRAFGQVTRRAARLGMIEKAGYEPRASGNLSPSLVWRSMICEAVA